jgi:hypothetical protein
VRVWRNPCYLTRVGQSRARTQNGGGWRGWGGGYWRNLLLGLARIKKRREKVALSGHEVTNSWGPLKPSHASHQLGTSVWANWELVLVQLLAGSQALQCSSSSTTSPLTNPGHLNGYIHTHIHTYIHTMVCNGHAPFP